MNYLIRRQGERYIITIIIINVNVIIAFVTLTGNQSQTLSSIEFSNFYIELL